MKVQISGAGPTVVAESEEVEEVEVQVGPAFGAIYFKGRKGEDWIDLAWWDAYSRAAGIGSGSAIYDITSVFVAP